MALNEISNEITQLVERKNADYNRSFEKSVKKYGILFYCIRADDKLTRVNAFIKSAAKVNDERPRDTLLDIARYTLLLLDIIDRDGVDNVTKRN